MLIFVSMTKLLKSKITMMMMLMKGYLKREELKTRLN